MKLSEGNKKAYVLVGKNKLPMYYIRTDGFTNSKIIFTTKEIIKLYSVLDKGNTRVNLFLSQINSNDAKIVSYIMKQGNIKDLIKYGHKINKWFYIHRDEYADSAAILKIKFKQPSNYYLE